MSEIISGSLRLVDPAVDCVVDNSHAALVERICAAFGTAVGWTLEYAAVPPVEASPHLVWSAPVDPGVGASLRLIGTEGAQLTGVGTRSAAAEQAVALAEGIAELCGEVVELRAALHQREAELAASVPVIAAVESPARMAERLEAILKSGAEAVGCQRAGLYLLDAGTTSLKLRASYRLPERRLLAPARPLRGALADLEALLGHAVVLSEPGMFEYWRAPEQCGAAVCVPVSSPSTPLGTFWVFSDMTRDFNDEQTNMLEVVAGRLAAELEREVLLADARQNRAQRQQISSASQQQLDSLPQIGPVLDDWQVAGRLISRAAVHTAFFDWFAAEQGCAVTLGAAVATGVAGSLSAAELRSALRAQASRLERTDEALACAHDVLSGIHAETLGVSGAALLLPPRAAAPRRRASDKRAGTRPAEHSLKLSTAGSTLVLLHGAQGWSRLERLCGNLGGTTRPTLGENRVTLEPKDFVVAYGWGAAEVAPKTLHRLAYQIEHSLPTGMGLSAEQLADAAADLLEHALPVADVSGDAALVIVQSR